MRIEDCLRTGWRAFTRDPASYVFVTFVLIAASCAVQLLFAPLHFPFSFAPQAFISGLLMGGFMNVSVKGLRGEKPTLAAAFEPCTARQGDYLLVGLASIAGILACGVGVLVTQLLFAFAPLLVVQGAGYKDALVRSKDLVVQKLADVVVLWLAIALVNLLGAIAFGVGLLVTLPVSMLALVEAHARLAETRAPDLLPPSPPA